MLGSEESTTQIQDRMYQKWGQKGKERKKVHVGPSKASLDSPAEAGPLHTELSQ